MTTAEHISSYFKPFELRSVFAGIGPSDVHNRDPRSLSLVASGADIVGDGVLAKRSDGNIVLAQMAPWQFQNSQQANLRRTFRRTAAMLNQLLANLGVAGSTPLLDRFLHPVDLEKKENRWLAGFYLDQPEEWDDPYRFFRW